MRKLVLFMCLVFCISVMPSALAAGENIALYKNVYSRDYWSNMPPTNLTDGNYATEWAQGSMYHTSGVDNVIVDLGAPYIIDEIKVYNRTSLNQPTNNSGWGLYLANSLNFSDAIRIADKDLPNGGGAGGCWTVAPELETGYRYIRVSAGKDPHYGMSEIEVYGAPFDPNAKVISKFEDVNGTIWEGPATMVSNLEILPGISSTEFAPALLLTRYNALKAVMAMLGNGEYGGEATDVFEDIPVDDFRNPVVSAGLQLGIISQGRLFRPDDYVTGLEFGKMIACAMGYGIMADAKGSWTLGYYDVCRSLDIFNGLSEIENTEINRGDAAVMLYNALKKPMYEASGISEDNIIFDKSGKSMLEQVFGLNIYSGIVKENSHTSLFERSANISENRIKIDNTVYYDSTGKADKYIGMNVMALVDEDNVINDIWPYRNTTVKVYASDIKTPATSSQIEVYTENGEEKYKLGKYNVLRNGDAYPEFALQDLDFDCGYVELIDNNRDGEIEVIKIMDGRPIVVESFVYSDELLVISAKNGETFTSQKVESLECYMDGKSYRAAKIKTGNVVMVYANSDSTRVTLDVADKNISAVIKSYDASEILTDEKVYSLSKYYVENVSDDEKRIKMGEEYSIYTDSRGEVVWIDTERLAQNIMFIQKLGLPDGIAGDMQMRIFTEKGAFEIVTLAENVTIDGMKCSSGNLSEKLGDADSYLLYKFAFYKKNAEGKISNIEVEKDSGYSGNASEMIKLPYEMAQNGQAYINGGQGFFIQSRLLQPCYQSTPIFVIPTVSGNVAATESRYDSLYKISRAADAFPHLNELTAVNGAKATFYVADDNNYPLFGVKYLKPNETTSEGNNPIRSYKASGLLVEKVSLSLNSEGETAYKIVGFDLSSMRKTEYLVSSTLTELFDSYKIQQDGKEWKNSQTYMIDMSLVRGDTTGYTVNVADLKCGDVIRYETSLGEISAAERVFSAEDGGLDYPSTAGRFYGTSNDLSGWASAAFMLRYGYVTKVKESVVTLKSDNTNDVLFSLSDIKAVKLIENGKAQNMSKAEIEGYVGDKNYRLLIYYSTGVPTSAIIYRY